MRGILYYYRMKNWFYVLALLLVIIGGCKSKEVTEVSGKLRLVNASYLTGDINLWIDYDPVFSTNTQYLNYSLFRNYIAGHRKLQIKNASGTVIVDTMIHIEDKKTYSVYLYDSMNTVKYKEVEELFFTPSGSNCKIRFMHLSNDAPVVNVTQAMDSTFKFSNYTNGDISNYISMPTGQHTFHVKDAVTQNNFYSNTFEYKPGYLYTLYLKGNMASQWTDSIGIFTIQDNGNY